MGFVAAGLIAIAVVALGTLAYVQVPALRSLVQQTAPAKPADAGIGLKAERNTDNQIALTWNYNDPQIANATKAILFVKDGRRSSKLALDNAQLRSGKLLYSPRSRTVQFRLQLDAGPGRTIEESLEFSPRGRNTLTAVGLISHRNRGASISDLPVGTTVVTVPVAVGETANGRPGSPSTSQPALVDPPWSQSTPSEFGSKDAYVAPRVAQEVMPQSAPQGHFAKISVQVSVDPTGQVTNARLSDAGDNTSPLATPALSAAREWRFLPATLNGKPVSSEYKIVFSFRPPPA
jgi:TonB family protein